MNYDEQEKAIAQQRARYLQQQNQQAPEGRIVGGRYVAANPLEYLAAGLRGYGGFKGEQQANQELTDLQGKKQQAMQGDMSAMLSALRGTPEKTISAPSPFDTQGAGQFTMPAQAGSMDKFYETAAASQFPQFQQMGMQGAISSAQQQAQAAQKAQEQQRMMSILQSMGPQEAVAAGVPPEMVKNYHESRNFGRDKVSFVDTGGAFTPKTEYGDVPANVAPIQKTGDPFSSLLVRGADGKLIANEPLVGAKSRVASAGAAKTNVSVNMPDKKFYEGLGTAVSGQIEKGFDQAQSAVQTLNNANQISQSLSNALVGPLANQRLTLAQIGQTLGVAGKDSTEILQNTRNVIQGLARQELSAAGQMKGQGQITESERAILRKAEAGQINEFTKPELETFLAAIRKTARSRIATHERNLQNLGTDPQAATILPYLQIQAPEDSGGQPATPSTGMPTGFKVVR
jgi:hypothetical protein